jgi:hypothetical protein
MFNDRKTYKIRLLFETTKLNVNLITSTQDQAFLSCKSFVQFVSGKRLAKQPSSARLGEYGLFELSHGVERQIDSAINVFELSSLLKRSKSVQYVIRKKSRVESNVSSLGVNLTKSQKSKITKFFKQTADTKSRSVATNHKLSDVVDRFVVENSTEGYRYTLSIRVVTKKVEVLGCQGTGDINDSSSCFLKERLIQSSCKEIVFIDERLITY